VAPFPEMLLADGSFAEWDNFAASTEACVEKSPEGCLELFPVRGS